MQVALLIMQNDADSIQGVGYYLIVDSNNDKGGFF